jgi:transposase
VKLSAVVDDSGLPISIFIAPANINDSRLYFPVMDRFEIKLEHGEAITRPEVIIADASFDTKKIREYNLKSGIKSVIPVNPRNRKKSIVEMSTEFDKEIFKKRSSIERFFSRI